MISDAIMEEIEKNADAMPKGNAQVKKLIRQLNNLKKQQLMDCQETIFIAENNAWNEGGKYVAYAIYAVVTAAAVGAAVYAYKKHVSK